MSVTFAELCKRYFALCLETGPGLLPRLTILLAALYAEVLRLPEEDAGGDMKEARLDYRNIYAQIGAAFPELGFYHICLNPLAVYETPVFGTGDAIDDLADIYLDLHESFDFWNEGHSREAVWQWKSDFHHHWGAHLVAVQAVLYAEMHI